MEGAFGEILCDEGALGGLFRRSVTPAGAPWVRLGIVHGYGDHSERYAEPMAWWAARGAACHAVDLRGHGRAAGRRGVVGRWDEYLADLETFRDWLTAPDNTAANPAAPLFLVGHSHGGLVVAAAAERGLPGVAGCILSAPFLRSLVPAPPAKIALARLAERVAPHLPVPSGLKNEWMTRDPEQRRDTDADALVFRTVTPRWYFSTVARQEQVLADAGRIQTPLLILMGGADRVADPEAARQLFEKAGAKDKTLRLYPDRPHELLRDTDREALFAEVLAWLRERCPR